MTFANVIKELSWSKKIEILRTAKGWTQQEAADRCGATRQGYGNWEAGLRFPVRVSRKAIASTFGVPEDEIFSKEDLSKACKKVG